MEHDCLILIVRIQASLVCVTISCLRESKHISLWQYEYHVVCTPKLRILHHCFTLPLRASIKAITTTGAAAKISSLDVVAKSAIPSMTGTGVL